MHISELPVHYNDATTIALIRHIGIEWWTYFCTLSSGEAQVAFLLRRIDNAIITEHCLSWQMTATDKYAEAVAMAKDDNLYLAIVNAIEDHFDIREWREFCGTQGIGNRRALLVELEYEEEFIRDNLALLSLVADIEYRRESAAA